MPLFIDLHVDSNLTPDAVTQCHLADKAIQEKYGVRYLQIILNQQQGCLFCLMEGPDKESCERVHREAHGNMACNLSEITNGDFSALLAGKQKNSGDFTLNVDGTLDNGKRAVLSVNVLGLSAHIGEARDVLATAIHQHDGRKVESADATFVAVFDTCTQALKASAAIRHAMTSKALPMEFRMGLHVGLPLKETGNFFEEATRAANRFSFISQSGQITVCSEAKQLYDGDLSADTSVSIVNSKDEIFLNHVMDWAEKVWNRSEVTVEDFTVEVGVSKSQLTRKLSALTGLSPNDFLNEVRLRKAVRLLEDEGNNVSEAAMAIGFSNPSYFTRLFRKRFGKAPSDFRTH